MLDARWRNRHSAKLFEWPSPECPETYFDVRRYQGPSVHRLPRFPGLRMVSPSPQPSLRICSQVTAHSSLGVQDWTDPMRAPLHYEVATAPITFGLNRADQRASSDPGNAFGAPPGARAHYRTQTTGFRQKETAAWVEGGETPRPPLEQSGSRPDGGGGRHRPAASPRVRCRLRTNARSTCIRAVTAQYFDLALHK